MENKEFYEVRIVAVETICFSLVPKPDGFEGTVFNFDFSVETGANVNNTYLLVKANVNIRDGEKPDTLGQLSILVAFEINGFSDYIKIDKAKNTFTVPDDLDFHTRTLTLSSLRGAMHSTFKGTYLHSAALPIIGSFPKLKKVPKVIGLTL